MFDINLFRFFLITPLALALAYPIMHKLLLKMSTRYTEIKIAKKQIVVAHHAIQALVLSILLPIFTYYVVQVNFVEVESIEDALSNINAGAKCSLFIMMMYMFELSTRFEELRPIVVFHHVLAYSVGILLCLFPSSIMVKSSFLLVYFIVFEAPIFMGLYMYRIFPNSPLTPKIIFIGMVMFGITRPLQVLWVGAAIFGSWNDGDVVKWQGVMQMTITVVMTVVQLFTLSIHYGIWKRCIAKQASSDFANTSTTNTELTIDVDANEEIEKATATVLIIIPTLTLDNHYP